MLVADIGNSRIKWAAASGGALGDRGASAYEDDTLGQTLDAVWGGREQPGSVVYCSVGAAGTGDVLEGWVKSRWGVDARRVRTVARGFGVSCAYPRPETLGADRWAALVAWRHQARSAAVIVDCGTAITLDAISEAGEHLGGVIVPGIDLMRLALSTRTDQIPAEGSENRSVFARSTADGVAAGTLYAAAAAVDRLVAEMSVSLPADSARVLTGGAMDTLRPLLLTEFEIEPDLVLKGLAIIGGEPA